MNNEEIKKMILGLMAGNTLGVVSTSGAASGAPESALVAFAEKKDLSIIFGTANTARKYTNLQTNPNISFVIGWNGPVNVQYEGVAKEVSREEFPTYAATLKQKNPQVEKFLTRDDERLFLVTPRWIRIQDVSKDPEELFEVTF